MSPFGVFSPVSLDKPNMPQNLSNDQPRRKANPSAQSVHQAPEMEELAGKHGDNERLGIFG